MHLVVVDIWRSALEDKSAIDRLIPVQLETYSYISDSQKLHVEGA
jgi:hypothetical protein